MTVTTTETKPQINGDKSAYESKFLPKVTAIPVVSSLKKQLYTHVPHAETLTKYVGDQLSVAFDYTKDTPIQGVLIKLDTFAASGMDKLEKEVPAVNTPTEQVLKKTKVDSLLGFVTHYYIATLDFASNLFNSYKGVFDPVLIPILERIEAFVGAKPSKDQTLYERVKGIGGVVIVKVDGQVTPVLNKSKETATSIYTDKLVPITQYPMKLFTAQKEKANETYSPILSDVTSRYTKAETAAKDAWTQTKPDASGAQAVIPTIKSGVFVLLTFGYNLVYPEGKKPDPKGVESQTNGLVSGIELNDGGAKKRANGTTS